MKKDTSIQALQLSKRSYNVLKKLNIITIQDLLTLSVEDIKKFRGIGEKSFQEILSKIEILKDYNFDNIDIPEINIESLSNESIRFITEIAKILDCNTEKLILSISNHYLSLFKNQDLISENEYIIENIVSILWEEEYGKEKWLKYIIKEISKNTYGIKEDTLWENIPKFLKDKKIYKRTIEYLCEASIIKNLYDDRFVVTYKSIKEEIYNYFKGNEAEIILKRISGKTLEEIGETLNLTRERIRQIESRGFKKLEFERFKEDFFLDIFLKYDVNREVFLYVLKEEETYNYLSLRYRDKLNQVKSLKKTLQEILEDEDIPTIIRRNFEKFIYKNYITYDKERILFGRASFIDYLIKHFANDGISYNEFKEIYYMFISDLGYEKEETLKIVDRSYENRIRDDMNVLWKPGKKFRYYNILGYDFSEFLETLNLNQYRDEEYSSMKFFKMYPDLMEMYDIRDEYELHNLLKKICTKDKYPQIKFSRMPSIEFGKINREQQVKGLLSLLSPISKQDFIKEYENFYGIDSKTFSANYLFYIEKYNCSGVYDIKFEEYDSIILADIRKILFEELYTLQEVKEKLKESFPNCKKELLNPILLRKIGYKISGGYIVKDQYSSASDYFFQFLQKNEIVKLNNVSSRIKSLSMFVSQIYKLKETYEIIEFSPNYFINFSKLKKLGITKKDLKQYCLKVLEFIGKDKYFTTFSLKKNGFYHELDELGFDDYFHTSILIEYKNRISYRRIGKNKLMYSDGGGACFEDFLERIVYKQEKLYIEVYDLNDLLREEYNIVLDVHDVISSVRSTSMYYDPISKIVFADYEIYYEVI